MSALRWAVLAALAVPAWAQAQLVEIAWAADGRAELRREVAAGKFLEFCGALAKGDAVRWQFSATAPLDFNIHYHQGKRVVYPSRLNHRKRASHRLAVAVAQDYCWMWTNKGKAPVQLSAELQR